MDDFYIQRILEGDSESYRFLISKYKDMAYSIAMSIVKNEFDAEEILQISFVNAFKNLHSFKKNSKYSTWLYKIVINESFKKLKKKKTEIIDFKDNPPDYSSDNLNPLLKLVEDDQKFYINEALKHLPAKECLILRLFYLEQNSIEEVREITGWSTSDIKVTLYRARIRIKQVLTEVFKLDNKVL
jgi:RNA polymerase sigma-70 factor (ECF subfamily)